MPPAVPLDPDAPALTRATARAIAGLSAIFLVRFTGFTEVTSASEGHFKPVLVHGTTIFMASAFFFLDTFVCFTGVLLATSMFLFFEASVKASVSGTYRDPYGTLANSNTRLS
jgi:hypothetical protein